MKTFKQILKESTDKMKQEREERAKAGILTPEAQSEYLSRGHDSEDFDPSFFDKGHREKLHAILRKVYNVTPGQEETKPDLWAAGPTIKLKEGETYVAVRPLEHMGQTHSGVFPEAYENNEDGSPGRSHPHVYGRVDHVRKEITMQTNHRMYFSSGSLDKIQKELKQRYPQYSVVNLIDIPLRLH
jgi:hypothetical protein